MQQGREAADRAAWLLGSVGEVRVRAMFGGYGLFLDDLMIALVAADRLYLKTDEQSVETFRAAGSEPFVYTGGGRVVRMSYWRPPEAAEASPQAMAIWADRALEAARRAKRVKRGGKARPRKRGPGP